MMSNCLNSAWEADAKETVLEARNLIQYASKE